MIRTSNNKVKKAITNFQAGIFQKNQPQVNTVQNAILAQQKPKVSKTEI